VDPAGSSPASPREWGLFAGGHKPSSRLHPRTATPGRRSCTGIRLRAAEAGHRYSNRQSSADRHHGLGRGCPTARRWRATCTAFAVTSAERFSRLDPWGGACALRSLERVQSAGGEGSGSRRWMRVSIRARRSFTSPNRRSIDASCSPNRRSIWTRKSATVTCSWMTAPTSTTIRATMSPAQRFRQPFPLLMLSL